MKCKKCKNRVNDYDKFCGNCGNELSSGERYERLELKIKSLEEEISSLKSLISAINKSFKNHETNYKHDMNIRGL